MKRYGLSILIFVITLFMAACSSTSSSNEESGKNTAENSSEENYKFTMAHGYPTNHIHHKSAEWFNEQLQERSGGRLSIEIYPNAQLVPPSQEVSAMLQGQVDMVHSLSMSLSSSYPIWNIFELPFIHNYDKDDPSVYLKTRSEFILSENGGQKVAEAMEKEGVKVLGMGYSDYFGGLFTKDKLVTSLENSNGLKIRSGGGIITPETIKALGSSSITISASESVTALQQGLVDAMLTTPKHVYDTNLPVKYFTVMPLFNTVSPMLISKQKFDALPKDLQDILIEVGREYTKFAEETVMAAMSNTLTNLENERGIEIYYPTEEELKEFKEATQSSWVLYEKEVEGGTELIKALKALE